MRTFSEAFSAMVKTIRSMKEADPRLIQAEELCREEFAQEIVTRRLSGQCYNIVVFTDSFPASMDVIFTSSEINLIVRYPNGAAEAVESLKQKLQALFPEKEVTSYWP